MDCPAPPPLLMLAVGKGGWSFPLAFVDASDNPIDLTSLQTASRPSGTLVIDTTVPAVSSPTLTVAQNAGATPIGIAAPTDNLTAAAVSRSWPAPCPPTAP